MGRGTSVDLCCQVRYSSRVGRVFQAAAVALPSIWHEQPFVEALRPWLEVQLERLSKNSELAKHIRYALKRWDGLCRFLHDGRIEMDTNPVENLMRSVTRDPMGPHSEAGTTVPLFEFSSGDR